jgi:hypothetical protein
VISSIATAPFSTNTCINRSTTEPAVAIYREAIYQGKILVLCELREIVLLLEQGQDVKDFFKKKIDAAIIH